MVAGKDGWEILWKIGIVLMDFVHDVNGTMGHGAIAGVQTRDHYKRSQKKSALSHKIAQILVRNFVHKSDYLQTAGETVEVYPLSKQEERGINFILI